MDDCVDVRDFPTSDTNRLSVSAWVYAQGTNGVVNSIVNEADWRHIPKGGTWHNVGIWQFYLLLFGESGHLMAGVAQRDGKDVWAQENRQFPLFEWQHVAFVADGSILRLVPQRD